jgi:hypothetical protein
MVRIAHDLCSSKRVYRSGRCTVPEEGDDVSVRHLYRYKYVDCYSICIIRTIADCGTVHHKLHWYRYGEGTSPYGARSGPNSTGTGDLMLYRYNLG